MVGQNSPIRLLLCDDVAEMRALLRGALEAERDMQVVGEVGDGAETARAVAELQPDVVLLDLSMPGLDGLEAIPLVLESSPRSKIVVFSGFEASRMSTLALRAGADRYIEKGEPLEALFAAVREVADERRVDGGGQEGSGRDGGIRLAIALPTSRVHATLGPWRAVSSPVPAG